MCSALPAPTVPRPEAASEYDARRGAPQRRQHDYSFFFSSRRRDTRYIGDWIQTCALPICGGGDDEDLGLTWERAVKQMNEALDRDEPANAMLWSRKAMRVARRDNADPKCNPQALLGRCEERRVGKEGRARLARAQDGKSRE